MISVHYCSDLISQYLPEPHAGLLSGILFGTKASLTPDLYDALVTTGTLHIAALSGMNITILTKMINVCFVGILPRKLAGLLTIAIITGFVLFVGPSPSIVRAAIMGGVSIIAVLFGRQSVGIISWGIACGGMLIFHPGLISDLSFQLSSLASLGLVLFGEGKVSVSETAVTHPAPWKPLMRFFYEELRTTLAAQVFTIPLLFFVFRRLSIISPLANILIGWTIPIVTVLGLVTCVVGSVVFSLGQILAWGCWVFLHYIIVVVGWVSRIPMASVGF